MTRACAACGHPIPSLPGLADAAFCSESCRHQARTAGARRLLAAVTTTTTNENEETPAC